MVYLRSLAALSAVLFLATCSAGNDSEDNPATTTVESPLVLTPQSCPPGWLLTSPIAQQCVAQMYADDPITTWGRMDPVSTFATSQNLQDAVYAVDFDTATRWSTGIAQAAGQYYQINANSCGYVNRVVMDSGASTNDYARGFQVFASMDGVNWGSALATGAGTGPVVDISFTPTAANYLQIVLTGSSTAFWSISDLHVYATDWCTEAVRKDLNTNIAWTATGYKADGSVTSSANSGAYAIDDNVVTGTVNCSLVADAYGDSQQATTNLGTGGLVNAGGSRYGTWLKMDTNCIPQGKTVTGATLKVKVYDTSVGAFNLYPMVRSWSETTSNWTLASTGVSWQTPGGFGANDVSSTVIGSIPANTATTQFAWVSIPLTTSTVAGWVGTPSSNLGMELRRSDTSSDFLLFYSREAASANQPYVQVTYTDQGNYTGSCPLIADNYMDSQQATSNFGTASLVDAGGSRDAALLKLDTSCLLPGLQVTAATLHVLPYDYSAGAFKIQAMNRSWSESTSTWNLASTGTSWQVAGANGASDVNSTVIGAIPANTATSTYDGDPMATIGLSPSVVNGWFQNPATNYGMKMTRSDSGFDYLLFYSRDAVAQNRPYVSLFYKTGPNVTTRFATEENQTPGEKLQVNFGICHAIDRVVMTAGSWPGDYPRGYEVYFSMDGVNWGSPVATGSPTSYPVDTGDFTRTKARFMKIVQTGTAATWWSVDNLQVYGHPCYSTPSNYTDFVRPTDGAWTQRQQDQFNDVCRGRYDEPCSGGACWFGPNGFSQAWITSTAPIDFPPPWGQWHMDESTKTAANSALTFSPGDNLTLMNGALFTTSGHVSGALSLDGIDDYAVTAAPSSYLKPPTDRFALSAWVKLTATDTSGGEVVSQADNYGLRVNADGSVSTWMYDSTGAKMMATSTGINVKDGNWHNLIGNYDSVNVPAQVEVYVDGVLRGTLTMTAGTMQYPNAGGFYVGRHPTLTTYDFVGTIDDVVIYSDLLRTSDIASIMGTNNKYWYMDPSGYAQQQDTPPTPFWPNVTGTAPRGLGCCVTPGMGACGLAAGYQPCTACGGGGAGDFSDLWSY